MPNGRPIADPKDKVLLKVLILKKPKSKIQAVKGTARPNKKPIIRFALLALHFFGLSKKSFINFT